MPRTIILTGDADLTALATDGRWRLVDVTTAGHVDYAQTAWETPTGAIVRRVDHHTGGVPLITVHAGSELDTLTDHIRSAVDTIDVEDLLTTLTAPETEPVELIRALRRLQLAHHHDRDDPAPLDPRYLELTTTLVAHPERAVRLTMMLVADDLATIWPELTAPILARHGVEEELAHIIEAFRAVAED
ncbi:hypothetical protein [Stackebrandtia soli]|uniref:hypothetical protein n=1 Tax=Stackebrandtia soli TaxID=1892856 RepID=UPI0039EA92A7